MRIPRSVISIGYRNLLAATNWSQSRSKTRLRLLAKKNSLNIGYHRSKSPSQSSPSAKIHLQYQKSGSDWHLRESEFCFRGWSIDGQGNDTDHLLQSLKVRGLLHSEHSDHRLHCLFLWVWQIASITIPDSVKETEKRHLMRAFCWPQWQFLGVLSRWVQVYLPAALNCRDPYC